MDNDSCESPSNGTTKYNHPPHAFLPALIKMEKDTIDPVLKEKYQSAIAKFRANECEDWRDYWYEYDRYCESNANALYDESNNDWVDPKGGHHPDEDFLYVNISYYKELDPRLYILCYMYFIKTYSFVEWYQQLTDAQRGFIANNLYDFRLTDIQIKVIKNDFNTPPSNSNINEILIEKSNDLVVKDYITVFDEYDNTDRVFYDSNVRVTYPMAGLVFGRFGKKDFDKINLYDLDDDTYSWLMQYYRDKLSKEKLNEAQIRDYAKIILNFGNCRAHSHFGIDETDSEKIKAVEYLLNNKEYMLAILKQISNRKVDRNRGMNSSEFFDRLFDELDSWHDFYIYFKKEIEGKWRRTAPNSFHKWGLIEAFNITEGNKKAKYDLEGNILTFKT